MKKTKRPEQTDQPDQADQPLKLGKETLRILDRDADLKQVSGGRSAGVCAM